MNQIHKRIIEVQFSTISKEQYQQVVDCYNSIKPSNLLEIKKLDRIEGGFEIVVNPNNIYECKQLRWNRKKLVPHLDYLAFSLEETLFLYRALCHVFDEFTILLHEE
jgi:hypothetical protein